LDSQLLLQLETQHLELQSLQEQPLVHLVVECLVLPLLLLHQGEAFLDNKIPVPVVEAFLDLHSHNKQALDSQQVLVCADSLFMYIVSVLLSGGGNRSTWSKPLPVTCRKSLTNFINLECAIPVIFVFLARLKWSTGPNRVHCFLTF
jgi:hypothetical protein